jgi:co-chaperonin GroES (HSP10)
MLAEKESANGQTIAPAPLPTLDPINDRVVVQADIVSEMTKGGVVRPDHVVGRRCSRFGTVVAVGPGALRIFPHANEDESGKWQEIDRLPMRCKVGDRVILPPRCDNVFMDPDDIGSQLMILPEGELLAIIK